MKTIEQKARAYDEVLNKLRHFIAKGVDPLITRADVQDFFPELKELNGEKIRKALIEHFKFNVQQILYDFSNKDVLAWLEKQGESSICNIPSKEIILAIWDLGNEWKELTGGSISTEYDTQLNYIQNHWHESEYYLRAMQNEQNHIDKVEPKFRVGDWIINPRTGLIKHIKNVLLCDNNGNYEFESSSMSIDSVDNSFHLWTIQDAKDGDVLFDGSNILLVKEVNHWHNVTSYLAYSQVYSIREYFISGSDVIIPATKEQRDLLFQKMKEAGYEWDAEKKELKKIEQTPEKNKGNIGGISSNSVWSKEDGMILSLIVNNLKFIRDTLSHDNKYTVDVGSFEGQIEWLQSLQDRVQPQPKQGLREEDEVKDNWEYIQDFIGKLGHFPKDSDELDVLINYVLSKKQKPVWSEEDKDYYDAIIAKLKVMQEDAALTDNQMDFLKSLRPQKCLIPSEEEIEKASQEWDSKANFNPFYMTTENGKPTGVKQSITTHKESFKAGVNWILKYGVQPKQEWSDVDKDILSRIIDDLKFLRDTVSIDPKYSVSIIDMEREITWLNSLRPQNKWKPSDEQMEALDWQVENTSVSSWQYKATKELMEDLKKLKENNYG